MSHRLFLYGTLCDPELFGIVAGTPLTARFATLPDHHVVWAKDESFPLILESAGRTAEGLLVEADETAKARMDFYELGFHYTLRPVTLTDGVEALVYFPNPGIWESGAPWSLAEWQATHGALTREAAGEYMRLFGVLDPEQAAAAFPQVRMRAASRLRARAKPTPSPFAHALSARGVEVDATRQPYTAYFAVREDDLAFPTFDGGMSGKVTRASFMGGDAVTILPYDPGRDEVLVVRQFRHGPFVRGDANPWTLEPAAGRVDPGEDPETTARRELLEETGVTAGRLHKVAEYYPSPGAYSEFLVNYVAEAELSERDGSTAGLDDEHEDIMSHVMPFEALMEMIKTGAANTGPLILSALWLARHRETLRSAD